MGRLRSQVGRFVELTATAGVMFNMKYRLPRAGVRFPALNNQSNKSMQVSGTEKEKNIYLANAM